MAYKCSLIVNNLDLYRPNVVLRTRPKEKLKTAYTNKQRVLKSSYYLVSLLWNQLDVDIQMSENYYRFVKYCKKLDVDNILYL